MRLVRIAAALVLAVGGTLALGSPAQAGGWATTLLDPLPDRLEAGRAYTVGYWVLQHGSHPYQGTLGKTGLRLVDESGRSTEYPGVRLREAAHYATAVVFPRNGTWRLYGIQGIFAEYEIGTVTVPGGLKVHPTPPPMAFEHGHGESPWGAIGPPGLEAAHDADPAGTPTRSADPAVAVDTTPLSDTRAAPLAAAVAVVALLLVALLAGWRWRAGHRRRRGDQVRHAAAVTGVPRTR